MGIGLFSYLKTKIFRFVPSYTLFIFLILAVNITSNKRLGVSRDCSDFAGGGSGCVFPVACVNSGLGVKALCQLDPLPFPEKLRVDTVSDINLSQMMPSLKNPRRQLCPDSGSLAML